MTMLELPDPPYFVVIFSARLAGEIEGYAEISAALAQLVSEQPGYLGHQSVTSPDGREITLSYWQSEAAIQGWRDHEDHQQVLNFAKGGWYDYYQIQVAVVERALDYEYRPDTW